jgi:hypothetical protein
MYQAAEYRVEKRRLQFDNLIDHGWVFTWDQSTH